MTLNLHPFRARLVLLAAALPAAAQAAVIRVPDDQARIEDAIALAQPGDEIWVSEAGSPYVLDLPLVLTDALAYRGGWDAAFVSQDASRTRVQLDPDSTGTVISADAAGTSVTFEHFTVGPPVKPLPPGTPTGQAGGMFVGGGSLLVSHCVFENNLSTASGGGIQIGSGSAARLMDCTFRNNETGFAVGGGRGGAVAVGGGADGVVIEHCTFLDNAADSAGVTGSAAGAAVFTASSIRLQRCRFDRNHSGVDGGALYVRNADLRAWGNLFYSNTAGRHGGAVYHENGSGEHSGTLIEDCVAGAAGDGNGGAIYFEGGSNRFLDGFIRRCEARSVAGGGVTNGVGGGLYFFQPLPGSAVRGTELVGNRADAGGAIGIQGTSSPVFADVALTRNTIAGNFAAIASGFRFTGGGIHVFAGFLGEIVNNIIAEQENGCGISCESQGGLPSPNIRFNCVWNGASNTDPEYGEDCFDRTGVNGNISQNPVLCCFSSGGCIPAVHAVPMPDLMLTSGSPCLGSGEGGADMGAHPGPTSCASPVSLEPASWGRIKARYR